MPILTLNDVDFGVGGPLLLDGVDLAIEPGERIAQMIIARYEQIAWQQVETLEETERSSGGFGSTGTV